MSDCLTQLTRTPCTWLTLVRNNVVYFRVFRFTSGFLYHRVFIRKKCIFILAKEECGVRCADISVWQFRQHVYAKIGNVRGGW